MSADIQDFKQVADEIGAKFDEFKAKNDKHLSGIEQERVKLSEHVDTLNGKLTELETHKKAVEEELLALKRPGATGSKDKDTAEHKAAFNRWFRKGDEAGLLDLQRKAMATDSDPDGGFIVPVEMDQAIERVMGTMSAMRRLARVQPVGSATYKKLVNMGGASSGWVGERDSRPETNSPQFKELEFPTMELYAEPRTTQSLLEDAMFDVESWLSDEVSIEFTEQEGAAFITGDGVKKPRGILGYNTVANANYAFGSVGYIASGAAGAFASSSPADAIITLVHSLKAGYRQNAGFLMNDLVVAAVRKLKDTDGNYLWRPGLELGTPSQLVGYAVETDDNMPDIAANSLSIAFGDFQRAYVITDRRGTQVLRDPYTAKPYVKYYTTKRVGGGIQNFEALKLLKFAE